MAAARAQSADAATPGLPTDLDGEIRRAQDLRAQCNLDEAVRALGQLMLAAPDDPRVGPLVHDRELTAVEGRFEIQGLDVVTRWRQGGVGASRAFERFLAVIRDEVLDAPGVARLEDAHLVTASHEFGDDSPKEMRIPVIPVAEERMAEER